MPKLKEYLFPTLLFVCSIGIQEPFWGWVDDMMFAQNFGATLSGVALPDTLSYHRGLSYVYTALYGLFPQVPVYSIVLLLYLYLASLMLWDVVQFIGKILPIWAVYVGFLGGWVAFWYESLLLVNFTEVAVFMMGLSLFHLLRLGYREEKSIPYVSILGYMMMFLIGYLTRPEMLAFPLSLFLPLALLLKLPRKTFVRWSTVGVLLLVGGHQVVETVWMSEDKAKHEALWPYVWSTLDGFNYEPEQWQKGMQNPQDSIRLYAAMNWFYMDTEKMGIPFFEQYGSDSPFTFSKLQSPRIALWNEYQKACCSYTAEYHQALNWWWKVLLFLGFNVCLCIMMMWRKHPLRGYSLLLTGCFLGVLMGVTVLMKMEGRVFSPFAIVYTLLHLMLLCGGERKESNNSPIGLYVLLVGLLLVGLIRVPQYHQLIQENRAEIDQKRKVMAELRETYIEKTLIFDYYSRMMVHDYFLHPIKPFAPNKLRLFWGQRGSHEFTAYRNELNRLCPHTSFIEFVDCMVEGSDDFVWVLPHFQARLYQSYVQVLYGRSYEFVRIDAEDSAIRQLRYSLLWFPMEMGYYRIRKIDG